MALQGSVLRDEGAASGRSRRKMSLLLRPELLPSAGWMCGRLLRYSAVILAGRRKRLPHHYRNSQRKPSRHKRGDPIVGVGLKPVKYCLSSRFSNAALAVNVGSKR